LVDELKRDFTPTILPNIIRCTLSAISMRIFVCGHELGLGFVLARRLVAGGHRVNILTSFEDLIPNLTKNGLNPVLGEITDGDPQRLLAKADAVIDAAFPFTFPKKRVRTAQLRPVLLRDALKSSGRLLIVTSHAAILGDTGPTPATEDARAHPLRGFDWALRLEEELSNSPKLRVVVVRPAWLMHGPGQSLGVEILNNWIPLSWRMRRGAYIGSGENRYSAIHLEDLAGLYCQALEKAHTSCLLHAAGENVSAKEVAISIHRAMKLKAEPKSISLKEARRLTPVADNLIRNHALSAARARSTFGWTPMRDSILRAIEDQAAMYAWARRRRIPVSECAE
jgi:nucleoside-diphosphate-sugar epimerase